MKQLITPESHRCADQCREMGVKVGDTIIGRETFGKDWYESRLTLIFLGREIAVFDEQYRSNLLPEFVGDGESSNWTLNCRAWFLEAA